MSMARPGRLGAWAGLAVVAGGWAQSVRIWRILPAAVSSRSWAGIAVAAAVGGALHPDLRYAVADRMATCRHLTRSSATGCAHAWQYDTRSAPAGAHVRDAGIIGRRAL